MSWLLPSSIGLLAAFYPIPIGQDGNPPITSSIAPEIVEIDQDRARRMTVPVSFSGFGPYNFVIDTGSERTVLSKEIAFKMELEAEEKANLISVAGSKIVDTVFVPELTLGRRTYDSLISPILNAHHIGADGILGLDGLQDQRILFDFGNNQIAIEDINKRKRYSSSFSEIVVTARRRSGQLIFTDATISGVKVNVVIDTGAQMTLGNRALQRKLRHRSSQDTVTEIISVTGQTIGADIKWGRDFRIGRARFSTIPIAFADAPPFEKLGLNRRPSLLLGMDVLRKFDKVAIDFAKRRIHFVVPKGARRHLDQKRDSRIKS